MTCFLVSFVFGLVLVVVGVKVAALATPHVLLKIGTKIAVKALSSKLGPH